MHGRVPGDYPQTIADLSHRVKYEDNRPYPSWLVPLHQNESKCKTVHVKMISAYSFIFIQIKLIFIRMVSHLDSF